jgi:4-amino-4-deoxy-L-arabinose transferase-like glycosyltransferase
LLKSSRWKRKVNLNGKRWAQLSLLLLALAARVYYLQRHVVVLEGEGAGYARQAESLLSGRGFESYLYVGPDLEHCWLQPIFIAAVYMFVGNVDTATHVISLAFGALLVLWVFLIADRTYGRKVAWIAALLTAFHPLLIALSTTGYAEILAMGLQFGAIYWSIRLIEHDGGWCWLVGGVLWGLAYLNRTECLVLPLFTVALFCLRVQWKKESLIQWGLESARFLAVFALFVVPYAFLFYHYTGKVRFEGKNLLNYTIGQRILEGKSVDLAERELTPDLQEIGPDLNTSTFTTYSPYPTGVHDLAKYFLRNARRNKNWLLQEIPTAPYLGSILLFLLAFLGLVGRPWDIVRFFREIYLGGVFAYILILLLAAHIEIRRYAFPILPFILLWASAGIDYFTDWMSQTASNLRIRPKMGDLLARMGAVGLVFWMFQLSFGTIPSMYEFNSGWAPNDAVKEAGAWLRATVPGLKKTYGTTVFAHYSFSYECILPFTDSATALRYIRKKNPDYIFLDSANSRWTPYYEDWLSAGIPDPAAVVIYQKDFPGDRRLVIYRWNHSLEQPETREPVAEH